MLGYSRVPYAAALDGKYFRIFSRSILSIGFLTFHCWRWGGGGVFCFFRLADVIAALVVIRITLQFLVQAIGVIVLRIRRPDMPRPFRMWFYPLPALIASIGFGYILFVRVNALKEIRYAFVILILGIAIYLARAWRHGNGLSRGLPQLWKGSL